MLSLEHFLWLELKLLVRIYRSNQPKLRVPVALTGFCKVELGGGRCHSVCFSLEKWQLEAEGK